MNTKKMLNKVGIAPLREINFQEKNNLIKEFAELMLHSFHNLNVSYEQICKKMFQCKMYIAKFDIKLGNANYVYKNNAIYVDYAKNIKEMDDYIIHELIHYLQNFNHVSKEDKRAGLCQFLEFKIFGLGLNEAIVQYLTAKAQFKKAHRVSNDRVTIVTNSEEYYKYITSLAIQILFLIGERKAIDSCINSNDNFENELYNTFEENTEKDLKTFAHSHRRTSLPFHPPIALGPALAACGRPSPMLSAYLRLYLKKYLSCNCSGLHWFRANVVQADSSSSSICMYFISDTLVCQCHE